MKVLLAEDNHTLLSLMHRFLKHDYVVETVQTGGEAIEIAGHDFDAMILDLGLPDIAGLIVCKRVRDLGIQIPILVVTADDRLTSRVELLNAGADDYVVKSFHADEIKARLSALLRRPPLSSSPGCLEYGDLIIDVTGRRVTRAGTDISLRRKEFDILEYLVRHPGEIKTREMILQYAWDSSKPHWTGVVDVHIKRLRDKVDRPFLRPMIKTSYGLGYKVEAME